MPLPDRHDSTDLPAVLAGPILRRLEPGRLVLWLVGSRDLQLTLRLAPAGQASRDYPLGDDACQRLMIGKHAVIHLIDLHLDTPLPQDELIAYDLLVDGHHGIAEWATHLLYDGATQANFVLRSRIDHLLHGSCRKPHHPSNDGLLCADRLLATPHTAKERPAVLLHSGDQVYVDDVAGPMLRAVHQLIERLGLYHEKLDGAVIEDSADLYDTRPAITTAPTCCRR